jgi:hypothetical protein
VRNQVSSESNWRVGRDNYGSISNQQDNRTYTTIDQRRVGTVNNVGRDQRNTYYQGPVVDVLPGPAGRIVVVLGAVVTLAGFAAFAYPVLSFILVIFDSLQEQQAGSPDLSSVHFTPWIPLGLAVGVVGGLISMIGGLMRRRR